MPLTPQLPLNRMPRTRANRNLSLRHTVTMILCRWGKSGKAQYTFGGMAKALAPTTHIDKVKSNDGKCSNKDSDGSDPHLSYIDDLPLRLQFPPHGSLPSQSAAQPPAHPVINPSESIILPAQDALICPLCSVADCNNL